jgi:hypothetical protein
VATIRQLSFHMPPEAGPQSLFPVLETLRAAASPGPSDNAALYQLVQVQYAIAPRPEPIKIAEALGLITRSGGLQLTPLGEKIVDLRTARRNDLLHYLLYTAWDETEMRGLPFLWSYRTTCDELWNFHQVELNAIAKDLVEEVINRTHSVFEGVPGFDPSRVSFSSKSVRGVRKWLEALIPPVIEGDRFYRRTTCSAELLMLAVGRTYIATGAELDVDLLLTPECRNAICRMALLDPVHLDRLLDWLTPIYPQFLSAGTRTGSYGRFLRLTTLPTIEEVA